MENLINVDAKISKKIKLQMIIKAVNDTAEANGLVPTLLIFDAYSRMHHLNSSASNIVQRAVVINKIMGEVRKMMAKKQIRDVLNFKNDFIVNHFHDLFINSEVLIWRKGNAEKSKN